MIRFPLILVAVPLLGTLALGGGNPFKEEERTVALIEELGGQAVRSDILPGRPVVKVSLKGPRVTNAILPRLRALSQLEQLDLLQAQVTGDGLAHLAGM